MTDDQDIPDLNHVQDFLTNVMTSYAFTVVIRTHLLIESKFNIVLESVLPNSRAVQIDRMRFVEKVRLLVAFDLLYEEDLRAFLFLNNLRNKFAHNVEYELSEADADNLLASFSSREKEILTRAPKLPVVEEDKIWSRVLLYCSMLVGMLNGLEQATSGSPKLYHLYQTRNRAVAHAVAEEVGKDTK